VLRFRGGLSEGGSTGSKVDDVRLD
jgi:hypothetical protein